MFTVIRNKSNIKILILLFIVAFVTVFSSTYNPFNFRRMYGDSADYITVARGITRGYLPYRDLADNKGPLTYFLSVPGWFLGKFTGIWITELILMCISVLFAYKTALFFGNRREAFFGTAFSFLALVTFFQVNAGTEEYSLPFLMIALYIFTKYFFSPDRDAGFGSLIALGASFACAVLIRLNMFPLWAGFCLVIFAESIIQRRFLNLVKYLSGFCLGIGIIAVPVFLYLKLNGIVDIFLAQVVFGGAARGFSGSGLKTIYNNFYAILGRNNCALPLYLGVFCMITKFRQPGFIWYPAYVFSFLLMVLFLSFSSGGTHYNLVLVPFLVPAVTILSCVLSEALSKIKHKYIWLFIILSVVFSEGYIRYLRFITMNLEDNPAQRIIRAGKMIDENTAPGDKIIYLGRDAYIYIFTERDPASRYFQQGSHLRYNPGSKEEFVNDVLNARPAIIAISTATGSYSEIAEDWYAPIMELIEKDYRLLSDENHFDLFIKKTD